MSRRYFEEEMRYLAEAGKMFAEEHPEQAGFLDIDSVSDRDPYVERLFEGFAFLSGRVHERLDNEMPEYTESLIQLLQPHFLKPIPALSIVAFPPEPGLVQETTTLERGTEVRSEPVGPDGVSCRFTTTQDVRLQPLRLTDATLQYPAGNRSRVRLRFEVERGVDVQDLSLSPLRLYFRADAATASTMHRFFTRHLTHVEVGAPSAAATPLKGQKWIQPVGLEDDQALFPVEDGALSSLRLLQEYLCFRRKFWFVDLLGLDRFAPDGDVEVLEIDVFFDTPYPEERRFDTDHLCLHCTPAVNLFEHDAEPIHIDGEVGEHRVVPEAASAKGLQTYDVQSVTGVEDDTGREHEYRRFFEFHHDADDDISRYFTTSRRQGPTDRPSVYLSLGDAHLRALTDVPAETLTLGVRCTNGTLPREHLKEGMINRLPPDVPSIVQPRNLTQPTLQHPPPQQEEADFFWKLISHWSFNYQSVASPEAIRGLLELYDWRDDEANRRRLSGLQNVTTEAKDMLEDGAVLRGVELILDVEEGHFADEGDLCLFGLVLSRFLSTYATLNSFVHLTIVTNPSEQRYEWTPHRGTQPTL
jgi:type VI secretion system protein ImpG